MYQQLIASDTIFFFFQCDAILKKSESMSNKLLKKGPNCGAIAGPMGPQWVHNGSLLFILYNYKKKIPYLSSLLSCLSCLGLSKPIQGLCRSLEPSQTLVELLRVQHHVCCESRERVDKLLERPFLLDLHAQVREL